MSRRPDPTAAEMLACVMACPQPTQPGLFGTSCYTEGEPSPTTPGAHRLAGCGLLLHDTAAAERVTKRGFAIEIEIIDARESRGLGKYNYIRPDMRTPSMCVVALRLLSEEETEQGA